MPTYKTKGIIIKRSDFGEADKLITIYTDTEGKIRTKAKGIRWILSRNRGHLELFNYSDLVIANGKEIDTLISAYTIESFKNIRNSLKKTALAYYFAELCDKLTAEKEKNNKIFDLVLEVFRALDKNEPKEEIVRYYEINLLLALGYQPELGLCVHCRKALQPINNYFSCKLGGIVCPACSTKIDPRSVRISKDALKTLRFFLSYNLNTVLKLKVTLEINNELKNVCEKFLRYIAEKEFKSTKFIKEIDNLFKEL
ncbi:MAG: DNA repair protein RecO [Candidatus Berkelbacteria bacterium]|nr:DNA repair protein RecO [Candidatus Berkelbacteria bacterium]